MSDKLLRVITIWAVLALAACTNYGRQEQAGMVIGGALGGLLGTQVDGHHKEARRGDHCGYTLAGVAIGGCVGRSMDDLDRLKTSQTLETVRTGVSL